MKENNNNTIYKYSQLYDILLEKILANEWKANDKMPTERELSIRYNVSRVTVRDTTGWLKPDTFIGFKEKELLYLFEKQKKN